MKYAPGPTAVATLDLSSVDLSFAEDEDEAAAVLPMMPAMPEVEPPKPREEKPPEPERIEDPLPPDPEAPRLAQPEPAHEKMETPELEEPEKPAEEHPAVQVPAVAPKQAKIDAPPKPYKTIRPDYPKGARQRGEQGDVVLEIRVNAAGIVDRVDIVSPSGFPELDEAAVRAVRTARFTPAKSGRKSVDSTARLKLEFKLK